MADPNVDFSDFLESYSGHRPTVWDGHICSELDSFFIGPCSQSRNSNTLERVNFEQSSEAVLKVSQNEETEIHRFGHWACGWYELLLIHPEDTEALKVASQIAAGLEDYGVVNEEALSEAEYDEACEYWEGMSVSDRIDVCNRFGASIFAARSDTLPDDPTGAILTYLGE